ncbi:hypothetical protein [Vibrio sp. 10N.239.312.D08]|uniref:hypothetical protein n=1 Tax=Vibrio sp. 10N.239.312.D08 TaxID=3229978 RepID=UPI00354E91F8
MTTSNQITKRFQEIEANFSVYHQFIAAGNSDAAKFTQTKVESLCKELHALFQEQANEHDTALSKLEIRNIEFSTKVNDLKVALTKKVQDNNRTAIELSEANEQVQKLKTDLANSEQKLLETENQSTRDAKELKALRDKNPGLMQATIVDLNKKLDLANTKKSALETERKANRDILNEKTTQLAKLKNETVGYIPLSKWVKGKLGLQKYRIIETDDVSRIASIDDGSMYSGFIDTDFQLQVEISSGVLYKVHVSDWLCPVNPEGVDHAGDYPVELDKQLKAEFEKRISQTNPNMIKAVQNARKIKVADLASLSDEEKALLNAANIKTLYECVIFPPSLFLNFVRNHNTAVEIDEEMGKSLYDKLHYEGCSVKADFLLNEAEDVEKAISTSVLY